MRVALVVSSGCLPATRQSWSWACEPSSTIGSSQWDQPAGRSCMQVEKAGLGFMLAAAAMPSWGRDFWATLNLKHLQCFFLWFLAPGPTWLLPVFQVCFSTFYWCCEAWIDESVTDRHYTKMHKPSLGKMLKNFSLSKVMHVHYRKVKNTDRWRHIHNCKILLYKNNW